MPENVKYVVITAARDEEEHIEKTIAAVTRQTIRPAAWIVVDDASTDKTGSILERYASECPWIKVIHRPNRGFRKPGGGVVEAFYDGYKALPWNDWNFIVKL